MAPLAEAAGLGGALISVVLITFNGARFLDEQLASISSQTSLPAELIVCDDASVDATVHLVESFARGAPFEVRVVRHPRNRGITAAVSSGLELVRHEHVALADQDDRWEPTKLEVLTDAMRRGASLAFSDAGLMDDSGRELPGSLWEAVGLSPRVAAALESHGPLAYPSLNFVTGMTSLFRADLIDAILPIPTDLATVWHDGWIAQIAGAADGLVAVPRRLQRYRQHHAQQVGAFIPLRDVDRRWRRARRPNPSAQSGLSYHLRLAEAVRDRLTSTGDPKYADGIARLDRRIQFLRMRTALPPALSTRAIRVVHALISGDYRRFAETNASWLDDLAGTTRARRTGE